MASTTDQWCEVRALTAQVRVEDVSPIDPLELDIDGDFSVRYLGPPEQGLLVVSLLPDIQRGGGATWIATDGVERVAQYLAAYLKSVIPDFTLRP